jgi:hypothetical protein
MLASKHKLLQLIFWFFFKTAAKAKIGKKNYCKVKGERKAHNGEEPPTASPTMTPKTFLMAATLFFKMSLIGTLSAE